MLKRDAKTGALKWAEALKTVLKRQCLKYGGCTVSLSVEDYTPVQVSRALSHLHGN